MFNVFSTGYERNNVGKTEGKFLMYQEIKKVLSLRRGVKGLVLLALMALLFQPGNLEAQIGHRTETPEGFEFNYNRWPWPLHAEINERLEDLARKNPKIARTIDIGKTHEGRILKVIEITNEETGPGTSKPGLWMDGNVHSCNTGRFYTMYTIERMLFEYGKNPDTTRLIDTRSFYFLPVFDADLGERLLTGHPAWPGFNPDWVSGEDLNGDGYITQMRVKDESREGGYRYYREGPDVVSGQSRPGFGRARNPITGERERGDGNRNWAGEWLPEERGAGPYPFSEPRIRAVADFLTVSHKNIYVIQSIHSGGAEGEGRSYLVRPIMDQPYDSMNPEDNDFYSRAGAIWSYLSEGNMIQNNYMDYLFNASQEDEEGNQKGYGPTMAGFMNDWLYLGLGIHSFLPEVSGATEDYDGDGYLTAAEMERWNEEVGKQWFSPWTPYDHPVLGEVEIGGSWGVPRVYGPRGKYDSEILYDWHLYMADISPLLRIEDVKAEPIAGGKYRVVATVRNTGDLSTYVTRQAIKIRRDYPAVAQIQVTGGEVDGDEMKKLGHVLGKWAYIRYWVEGEDRSTATVQWTVEPTGSGPLEVTVEAWAPKAGRDEKTVAIRR